MGEKRIVVQAPCDRCGEFHDSNFYHSGCYGDGGSSRIVEPEPAWECSTYSTIHFDEALEDDGSCSHCRSRAEMAGCRPVLVVPDA